MGCGSYFWEFVFKLRKLSPASFLVLWLSLFQAGWLRPGDYRANLFWIVSFVETPRSPETEILVVKDKFLFKSCRGVVVFSSSTPEHLGKQPIWNRRKLSKCFIFYLGPPKRKDSRTDDKNGLADCLEIITGRCLSQNWKPRNQTDSSNRLFCSESTWRTLLCAAMIVSHSRY